MSSDALPAIIPSLKTRKKTTSDLKRQFNDAAKVAKNFASDVPKCTNAELEAKSITPGWFPRIRENNARSIGSVVSKEEMLFSMTP